jgi:hypothetical protein
LSSSPSIVERLFIGMIRGEPETIVELVHPQAEWEPTMWSGGEVYRGPEGVQRWLSQFGEALEHLDIRVEEIKSEDERAAVLGTVFDSRDEGMFAVRIAWSFELDGELVRRGRAHDTWEEAKRAAGLG